MSDSWESWKKYFAFPGLVLLVVNRGHGGTLIELNFDIPQSDFLQFQLHFSAPLVSRSKFCGQVYHIY